jgi:hypothetical protein
MRLTVNQVIQITFYAVIAYLVLVHNRGAIGLVKAVGGVYTGGVEALQGRSRPGRR